MRFQDLLVWRCLALLTIATPLVTPLVSSPVLRAQTILKVCDDVQDPQSLNPYKVFSEKVHTILQQMMEGLVRFDHEGNLEPSLAERWERINPTTVRFYLRKGVFFHNGEPFDANSVKFSLEKYVAPQTNYPGLGFVRTMASVNIVNDYTVDVITQGPDGLLLNRLAAWMHIVPQEYYVKVGEEGFSQKPVGTGPFKFQRWKRGKEISLSANRDYWMKAYPKVDQLIFRFVPMERQVTELLNGGVDIVTEVPGTETLRIQSSKNCRIIKNPTLYTVAASFNTHSGPLKDIRVRQALNYAFDKEAVIRYDVLGNGRPVHSLILWGYPETIQPDLADPYVYNLQLARSLLESAGFKEGCSLRMIELKATRVAKILQDYWKKIGITIEVVSSTDADMNQDMRKGPWDIMLGGCPDPMHHPYFIYSAYFHSLSPFSLTQDKELDLLIEQLVQELDSQQRSKKTMEIEKYVHKNALTLYTYQRIKTYGVNKGVDFEPPISGMPHFRNCYFTNVRNLTLSNNSTASPFNPSSVTLSKTKGLRK